MAAASEKAPAASTTTPPTVVVGSRGSRTFHCYYRPNRSKARKFSAQDAARIMCKVMVAGTATEAQILARRRKVCPDAPPEEPEQAEQAVAVAEVALEAAAQALAGDEEAMGDAYLLFLIVNAILVAIAALGLIFAPARPVRIAAVAASAQVAVGIRVITSARAANDAAFVVVRAALAALRAAA